MQDIRTFFGEWSYKGWTAPLRSDGSYDVRNSKGANVGKRTLLDKARADCKRRADEMDAATLLPPPAPVSGRRISGRTSAATSAAADSASATVVPGKWVPGPGRSNKKPKRDSVDPIDSWKATVQVGGTREELIKVGNRLSKKAQSLQQDLKTANAELIAEHGRLEQFEPGTRRSIAEVIGEGYSGMKSTTLKRHRRLLLHALAEIAGDDLMRQAQLASSVLKHYNDGATSVINEKIVQGLALTIDSLRRAAGKGRLPMQHNVCMQSIVAAALAGCCRQKNEADVSERLLAEILHVSWDAVADGKVRVSRFLDGTTKLPYDANARSAGVVYPPEFEKFVDECWQVMTRRSENKKDERRNPDDHQDKKLYRIRFLEVPLHVLLTDMCRKGERRYPGRGFHLSSTKMRERRPHYIRRPGRQTCLCRYHMASGHFHRALRKWSLQSEVVNADCACLACLQVPKSEAEFRRLLCCERQKQVDLSDRGEEPPPLIDLSAWLPCAADGRYDNPQCAERQCHACKDNLSLFTCVTCRQAAPTIKYAKWSEVPYFCKDGRKLSTHDFVTTQVSIEEFLEDFVEFNKNFLPHNQRAKFQVCLSRIC